MAEMRCDRTDPPVLGAFNDGSSGVLGQVPGDVGRVLVVGAGIAGLTVANALTTAGVDCVVLEARDRIGGRLDTVDVAGHPADLGGAWIHHPEGNILSDWLDLAGVPTIVDPTGTRFSGADMAERRRLTNQELVHVGYAALEPIAGRVAADLVAGRADQPVDRVVDDYLAETLASGAERDRLRQLMAALVEMDAAGPFGDISARYALTEDMLVGDVVDNVPVGGYRRVLAPLAEGVDIRLARPVRRIVQTDDGVRVEGDCWSESGTHVVVTVPLGVLKAGTVAFDPPLPPERRDVIGRTGFGNMEKVVLAFDEPFWRAEDPALQHAVIYPADRAEPATMTWDFGLSPTIMFLVANGGAEAMWRDPQRWAVEKLEVLYGGPLPCLPTGVASTDWLHDDFAFGSYSHVRPGEKASDFDILGEPVGRICFAGEHASADRTAYADGAMATGLREARRLLRTDRVMLTVVPH